MAIPNEERKCLVQPKFSINSDEDLDSFEFEDIVGTDKVYKKKKKSKIARLCEKVKRLWRRPAFVDVDIGDEFEVDDDL
jgi:hypothetical protein